MTHQHDDTFDAFLRRQLQQAQPYIPDDQFTAQVMVSLPAARRIPRWQEVSILVVPVLIIAYCVLSQFAVVSLVVKTWILIGLAGPVAWALLLLALSLMVSLGVAYVFYREVERV